MTGQPSTEPKKEPHGNYGFDNPIQRHDTDPRLVEAHKQLAICIKEVNSANKRYKEACTKLGHLKVDIARERGHPWLGFHVWRVVESLGRKKLEKGLVSFKDFGTPDYGNTHIPIGRYFVLTDKGYAKWLDESWQLELI